MTSPNKNIDTGSSVERVAMVLQDKASFFETDLFAPLLDEVQSLSGKHYGADEKHDVAIRIVGEHARATAFLVADGVQPSNEGRGYILRRMLRRVVSASRQLGAQREVFRPLVARVVDGFGDAYPELRENRAFIEEVLASEEDRFSATLRQGMVLFDEARDHAAAGTVTGADAFKLSDTFGFPIELTIELAADAGPAGRRGAASATCCRNRRIARARPPRRWRSGWTPARCPRRSSSATSSRRPRRRSRCCSATRTHSSRSPRRARRCVCSWNARRSTRKVVVRSGTAA